MHAILCCNLKPGSKKQEQEEKAKLEAKRMREEYEKKLKEAEELKAKAQKDMEEWVFVACY